MLDNSSPAAPPPSAVVIHTPDGVWPHPRLTLECAGTFTRPDGTQEPITILEVFPDTPEGRAAYADLVAVVGAEAPPA
jgi:hypothetical protein